MKSVNLSVCILLLNVAKVLLGDPSFKVFWNVPSISCSYNFGINVTDLLRTFGISVNIGEQFLGDAVTIFYDSQLGLYPYISSSGDVNGGVPQVANLTAHLNKSSNDIKRIIPNPHWNGLGVIDWEAWRPVWEFNWGKMSVYQNRSVQLVQEQDPDWSQDKIKAEAMQQWEDYSRQWMLETLILAKGLRPNGQWCYYLFPDCYNYEGTKPEDFNCSNSVQAGNNKLSWLWETSTALCPSIYLYESHLTTYTFDQRVWFTYGRLQEALRVQKKPLPVYPYINYAMSPGNMVPQKEFERMIGQVAAIGMEGAVIWGSSSSVNSLSLCQMLKDYILAVLGPTVEKVAWNVNRCRKSVCNSHGRCTWPTLRYSAWKYLTDKEDKPFYAGDIVCKCDLGYSGRYCTIDEMEESNLILSLFFFRRAMTVL